MDCLVLERKALLYLANLGDREQGISIYLEFSEGFLPSYHGRGYDIMKQCKHAIWSQPSSSSYTAVNVIMEASELHCVLVTSH